MEKMTLTPEQFMYLAIVVTGGITVAWITLCVCFRSQPNVFLALFADALFLRTLTVVFIIIAALLLALTNHLSVEVTAILAGIAGYVLGSARAERHGNRTSNHEEEKRETDSIGR